jgi:hypothetical protein
VKYSVRRAVFPMLFLLLLGFSHAYAIEPIPITYSGTISQAEFDGRWSFESEWKQTSLSNHYFDNGNVLVILRIAHQGDHVYVFIDMINDEAINQGSDRSTICIDSKNEKNQLPDTNDYCFEAVLGSGEGHTYQGDSSADFKQITNHPEFIGISSISDKNDRYSGVPHPGYEFKIPTDLIGRESVYGFYFEVYDDNTKKLYTYPQNQTSMIHTPSSWGEFYSPDKSLPEFDLPLLMLIPVFGLVILLTKKIFNNSIDTKTDSIS